MPNWKNHPPSSAEQTAYRIIRTPADKPLAVIATSTQNAGTDTHYANHRTTPCERPNPCELCEDGHSTRWHGYLAVLVPSTMEHAILEFTAAAYAPLETYQNIHDTLRGCGIIAKRPSGRPNGRVLLKCTPVDQQKWALPEPPNLIKILSHIWGIPYTDVDAVKTADSDVIAIHVGRTIPDARNGRTRKETPTKPARDFR